MIDNLIEDGYYVSCISESNYLQTIRDLKKQIKGKSEYENYSIIEYLPKNKEFYVIRDEESENESGYATYDFEIFVKYNKLYFSINDYGSN